MTLFVDASALVAIIVGEEDRDAFAARVGDDPDPLWSAMSCWEAISALTNNYGLHPADARREVEDTAALRTLRLVPIADAERRIAHEAYERYGKGRHEARLNMGDCFAYACAKTNRAELLYKGNDFIHTDLK